MPIIKAGDININYKVEGTGEPLIMIMGFGAGMEAGTRRPLSSPSTSRS